ncbi:MAG: hypothetical protein AAFV72_14700 [Cyanobacteria bacterium J06635_1]
MKHGILRVSETATSEIEAARAFVIVNVTSQKVAFGNAALTASEVEIGTQFKSKKKISATCTVEFFVQNSNNPEPDQIA